MELVCVACGKLMFCDKTGVGVHWKHGYIKQGDMYRCPVCQTAIIFLSRYTQGSIQPNAEIKKGDVVLNE